MQNNYEQKNNNFLEKKIGCGTLIILFIIIGVVSGIGKEGNNSGYSRERTCESQIVYDNTEGRDIRLKVTKCSDGTESHEWLNDKGL